MISDYEAWMQHIPPSKRAERPGQDICEFCKDINTLVVESICTYCSDLGIVGGSEKLGPEIVARNAGHTLFLTERGYHVAERFAITEGDIICWLLHGVSLFVLRKAEENHWTLVGHFVRGTTGLWNDGNTYGKNEPQPRYSDFGKGIFGGAVVCFHTFLDSSALRGVSYCHDTFSQTLDQGGTSSLPQ